MNYTKIQPFLKMNLKNHYFPTHLSYNFKKSFYKITHDNKNINYRYKKYNNYDVILNSFENNKPNLEIKLTKLQQKYKSIDNSYDPFLIEYINFISKLIYFNHNFQKINLDVYQIRELVFSLQHTNCIETSDIPTIHKTNYDYIIPSLVLRRFNIMGGKNCIFDKDKNLIKTETLNDYDFTIIDDKNYYNFTTPIKYYLSDGFEEYGYRDILNINITIIE